MQSCFIAADYDDDPVVLRIVGMLDIHAVDKLDPVVARLLAMRPERLLVDLTGLTFISSLGIGQLLLLCGNVIGRGGAAAIVADHPSVRTALARCRVEGVAPVWLAAGDAMASIERLAG